MSKEVLGVGMDLDSSFFLPSSSRAQKLFCSLSKSFSLKKVSIRMRAQFMRSEQQSTRHHLRVLVKLKTALQIQIDKVKKIRERNLLHTVEIISDACRKTNVSFEF